MITQEDRERLLEWLKDNARDMAADLRDAGWEEDERGLWRKDGSGRGYNLLDAHELATRPELFR